PTTEQPNERENRNKVLRRGSTLRVGSVVGSKRCLFWQLNSRPFVQRWLRSPGEGFVLQGSGRGEPTDLCQEQHVPCRQRQRLAGGFPESGEDRVPGQRLQGRRLRQPRAVRVPLRRGAVEIEAAQALLHVDAALALLRGRCNFLLVLVLL